MERAFEDIHEHMMHSMRSMREMFSAHAESTRSHAVTTMMDTADGCTITLVCGELDEQRDISAHIENGTLTIHIRCSDGVIECKADAYYIRVSRASRNESEDYHSSSEESSVQYVHRQLDVQNTDITYDGHTVQVHIPHSLPQQVSVTRIQTNPAIQAPDAPAQEYTDTRKNEASYKRESPFDDVCDMLPQK